MSGKGSSGGITLGAWASKGPTDPSGLREHQAASQEVVQTRAVPACSLNSPGVTEDLCLTATTTCPTGQVRFWIFVRPAIPPLPADQGWQKKPGTICLDPAKANANAGPSTAQLAAAVREELVRRLPSSSVGFQPPDGAIVNIDAIFFTDTPATLAFPATLLGVNLTITAHPVAWHWDFGDGSTGESADPGARYPNQTVAHSYRHHDTVHPAVTVDWQGSFAMAGATYPIAGVVPVVGPAGTLPVRQAPSVLVDGT